MGALSWQPEKQTKRRQGLHREFRLLEKAMIEADSWSHRELFGFEAALRVPHLDGKRI